jgi:hypothetical protein
MIFLPADVAPSPLTRRQREEKAVSGTLYRSCPNPYPNLPYPKLLFPESLPLLANL